MKQILCVACLISLLFSACSKEKQVSYVTETKIIQGAAVPEITQPQEVEKIKTEEKTEAVTEVSTNASPDKIPQPELQTTVDTSTEENNSSVENPEIKSESTQISISENKEVDKNITSEVSNSVTKETAGEQATEEEVVVVGEEPNPNLDSSKYDFSNSFNVKVFDAPSNGKSTDSLRKNTRVSVTEVKIVGDKTPVEYAKITYKKDGKVRNGWIKKSYLSDKITDSLPKEWNSLNFNPMPKKNYPNNPRKIVKGIYVSSSTIATTKSLERLIELANKTEINAFVIDVKNDDGNLLWKMPEVVSKYNLNSDGKAPIKDMPALVKKLKDNNIYLIARIVSFKDPTYAKAYPDRTISDKRNGKPFTNADGLIWVSAHDRKLWQYNIDVAKEAAKIGFNEIQFDYVRFPASNGGKLDKFLNYRNPKNESKPVAIQRYLTEAYKQLSPLEVYTAADVYGQVGSSPDDMALGQHWEAVSNVVDYICPMVYPSHYANGVYGAKVPDAEPYKTVYGSTRDSVNRNYNIDSPAVIRTWIQDFTASWVKGYKKYDITEVREQIKALNDLGQKEYILWNAANRYSMEKN